MKLSQTTNVNSVVEPVEIDQVRAQSRIEFDDEDAYLIGLITTAREAAEGYTDAIIADRAFSYTLDCFTSEIELPLFPIDLSSIAIAYNDTDDAAQTVASFNYYIKAKTVYLVPDPGASWPSTSYGKDKVQITFTAGMAGFYGAVPKSVQHAISMITATLYDQRRDNTMTALVEVPTSSKYLLDPYKKQML